MPNKINSSLRGQKLIVYFILAAVTLAVFWQVTHYDFATFGDKVYVITNSHAQSGITMDGFLWAFSTIYAEFWHSLTWLSLLLDYQLYGLNPCRYHLTSLFLHILRTLLLFWLFCRMTGAIWKSAFVAALFAIHPLHEEKYFLWQLKGKFLFFVLSAVFSVITIFTQHTSVSINLQYPFASRMAHALVSFITYLGKTFWLGKLAVYYPYLKRIPAMQVIAASLLIVLISIAVIRTAKRLPHLFVGWLWYACAIFPVIGIIPRGFNTMGDRFTYLPLIYIFIMLAWGMMDLIKSREIKKFILLPTAMVFIFTLSFLSWQQASYWKNSIDLFGHAVKVTKNNFMAHNIFGNALSEQGN